MLILPTTTASQKYGFPADPKPGQWVVDTKGTVWMWYPPDALGGLGDLGFWGALIGLGTSLVGGLFGGNKSKKEMEQAKQIIEQQQAQIAALEAKQKASQGFLTKKNVILIGFVLVAFAVMQGRR